MQRDPLHFLKRAFSPFYQVLREDSPLVITCMAHGPFIDKITLPFNPNLVLTRIQSEKKRTLSQSKDPPSEDPPIESNKP